MIKETFIKMKIIHDKQQLFSYKSDSLILFLCVKKT